MKLLELVKMFDMYDTHIIIWHVENSEEPEFRGSLSDCPYWLLDCLIDGPIASGKYTNEHGVEFGAVIVEVKE